MWNNDNVNQFMVNIMLVDAMEQRNIDSSTAEIITHSECVYSRLAFPVLAQHLSLARAECIGFTIIGR